MKLFHASEAKCGKHFVFRQTPLCWAFVGSVLKVYSVILQQKPDAKSKLLDGLLKKQSQGKLDEALGKECK
jgi:hypothetical protein